MYRVNSEFEGSHPGNEVTKSHQNNLWTKIFPLNRGIYSLADPLYCWIYLLKRKKKESSFSCLVSSLDRCGFPFLLLFLVIFFRLGGDAHRFS